MTMDAAAQRSSVAPAPRDGAVAASWSGLESPWVLAAFAAAPWPAWSLLAVIGVPGPSHVPAWLQGGLTLSVAFALMVLWAHRPDSRVVMRWVPSVAGTGLMVELLANALTDQGRQAGLSSLPDGGRALATLLICAAIYEVAPIVAATAKITASEPRWRSLDVGAYLVFALVAVAAYVWDPIHDGALWRASPWMAAAIAFPFAAARCGPEREAKLPSATARGGVFFGLALMAWGLLIAMVVADWHELGRAVWRLRWGAGPLEGLLGVLPITSVALSLGAAGLLAARAVLVRHAPQGTVAGIGDGGFTLERNGMEEPTWVALDGGGPLPAEASVVTLLGVRRRAPDSGPFRDGAPRLHARRAWAGDRRELSRALAQRAAGWLAWAAVSGLGVLFWLW